MRVDAYSTTYDLKLSMLRQVHIMEGCIWKHSLPVLHTKMKVRLSGDNQAPAFHLSAQDSKIELIM